MKKIVALLLFFSLLFPSFFSISVHAYNVKDDPSEGIVSEEKDEAVTDYTLPVMSCESALKDEETQEKVKDFRDNDANHLEQYTLDIVELVMNAININTLEQLLFGNPYCIWFDGWGEEKMVYGLFPESIFNDIIKPGFIFFVSLLTIVVCFSVMMTGLKMMGNGLVGRVNLGEEFLILMGVLLGIGCYWIFVEILLEANYAFVLSFKDLLESQGINLKSFSLVAATDDFRFTDILILFSEWMILFFLNILYMARLAVITFLTLAGGLALVLVLFKNTRKAFGKWLLDYVGAVFMQSVHSLYFTMVILFVSLNDLSFFFKFVLLLLFLPLSSMLLNMSGFASSASVINGATNKFMNSAGSAVSLARSAGAVKNKLPMKSNDPNALTTGATKISALATGSNSAGWDAFKKGAQLTGTIGGSMAGLVVGPGGAALGGAAGGALASGALQVPRNVTAGVKGILDTRSKVKNNDFSMDNISDKRQVFGAYGESIGAMFGQGVNGRKIGESMSGISKQQLLNSTELGGLGGVSLSDIVAKYPESKVLFEQTNMGSGFYLQNEDSKKLISPIGTADNTLPDGMTRTIEYSPLPSGGALDPARMSDGIEQASHFHANADQMGLYSMSEAPMLRDDNTGSKVFDHSFNSSMYKPEQHCNMGDFNSSIAPLGSSQPNE